LTVRNSLTEQDGREEGMKLEYKTDRVFKFDAREREKARCRLQ